MGPGRVFSEPNSPLTNSAQRIRGEANMGEKKYCVAQIKYCPFCGTLSKNIHELVPMEMNHYFILGYYCSNPSCETAFTVGILEAAQPLNKHGPIDKKGSRKWINN